MKTLIIFLLLCSTAYAGQEELDKEIERSSKSGIVLTEKDESDLISKGWRDRREGEFKPSVSNTVRPSDYANGIDRGTIEFSPSWKNYSWHKVLIQDGTVIDGDVLGACNFSQVEPNTDAIIRATGFGHDLTFRACNLVNVKTYPDWIIESSNNAQLDLFGNASVDDFNIESSELVASKSEDVPFFRIKPDSKESDGKEIQRLEK